MLDFLEFDNLGCRDLVEEIQRKKEMLFKQLEKSYKGGCTGSGSDVKKLIEKLDVLDEV